MNVRSMLLASFQRTLQQVGLIDSFRVTGVIATWWGDVQNDMKTIAARGFTGLVEAWEVSILTAIEDKSTKDNPLDHRLVKKLMPEYLDELKELEAKAAELDVTIKSATTSGDEDEEDDAEEQLSEADVKNLKKQLTAAKKELRTKQGNFTKRLHEAREELDENAARDLALDVLRADLDGILDQYVAEHRQQVVAAFENWWDKYRVTLTDIDEERNHAASSLRDFLQELGYA